MDNSNLEFWNLEFACRSHFLFYLGSSQLLKADDKENQLDIAILDVAAFIMKSLGICFRLYFIQFNFKH